MITLVLENQNIKTTLPITFENNQLTIPDKTYEQEPIKLEIRDTNLKRLDIVVGKLSEVKLLVEISSDLESANTYDIYLNVLEGSIVKYLVVGQLKSKDGHINHHVSIQKDAQLNMIGSFLSDQLVAEIHANLLGQGALINLKATAVSSQTNKQVIDAHITHRAPNTYGDMTNIGIVNEQGTIILNGIEKIEKGMKNANAYQTLKGIILSDEAVCEVNPILLIDEYDVKAGHGATVGKIEADQLYYLMSRGLSQKDAERLIINGFLQPIIDEIDDESLKERFIEQTYKRI
ncbi:MAG: SufD family Fe-S cluster assembly protein [Acholeplasmataceae bacterium]